MKLTIELVPKTSWYNNVRGIVAPSIWDDLRKECYTRAGHRCELCSDVGFNQGVNHAVECHEIWEYDDEKKTQTLTGLIALCPKCHSVKHAGLAQMQGKLPAVISQLMFVNNITKNDANECLKKAFDTWRQRSACQWTTDVKFLNSYLPGRLIIP